MHKEKLHWSFSSRTSTSGMWTLVSQVFSKVFWIGYMGIFLCNGMHHKNRLWNILSVFEKQSSYLLISPRYFGEGFTRFINRSNELFLSYLPSLWLYSGSKQRFKTESLKQLVHYKGFLKKTILFMFLSKNQIHCFCLGRSTLNHWTHISPSQKGEESIVPTVDHSPLGWQENLNSFHVAYKMAYSAEQRPESAMASVNLPEVPSTVRSAVQRLYTR